MIGLLTNGHILLEGVPGLGKTLALLTLAQALAVSFQRIRFTPDMLPADVVGTMIYNPRDGSFQTKHGPVFANLILADEINRAPAKVQSAARGDAGATGDPGQRDACAAGTLLWPRRTRSNRKGPTRCPRRRSTASC